jgi:hypothetical protein
MKIVSRLALTGVLILTLVVTLPAVAAEGGKKISLGLSYQARLPK